MKDIIKMSAILALIACIAGLALSGANMLTAPRIAKNAELENQRILKEYYPDMADSTQMEIDGIICNLMYDGQGNFLGVLAKTAVEGYSGPIYYYLSVNKNGEIEGITVISHTETPGIGTVITEPDFKEQFIGKHYTDSFTIGDDVDIVTGATVSTEAVILSVAEVAAVVGKEIIEEQVGAVNGS